MKYFTPELWLGLNSAKSPIGMKDWSRAWKAYDLQLKKLLPALSPGARNFFKNVKLHDGTLLSLEIGDALARRGRAQSERHRSLRKLGVTLNAQPDDGLAIFVVKYFAVSRAEVSYPGAKILFPSGWHSNLGDWGYDELTKIGENSFRHEVLFSSGASLLIECENIDVKQKRRF